MFRCLNLNYKRQDSNACARAESYNSVVTSLVLYFFDIDVDLKYLFHICSRYFRNSYEGRHYCNAAIIHQMETESSLWSLLT